MVYYIIHTKSTKFSLVLSNTIAYLRTYNQSQLGGFFFILFPLKKDFELTARFYNEHPASPPPPSPVPRNNDVNSRGSSPVQDLALDCACPGAVDCILSATDSRCLHRRVDPLLYAQSPLRVLQNIIEVVVRGLRAPSYQQRTGRKRGAIPFPGSAAGATLHDIRIPFGIASSRRSDQMFQCARRRRRIGFISANPASE